MKLFEEIIGTSNELKEIKNWCSYIGTYRYKEIVDFIRNTLNIKKDEKVIAYYVTRLSKYDFKLADILFSSIKFVESYLRATLISLCSNSSISKENYIHVFSKELKIDVPCTLKYNPNVFTTNEYIIEAEFEALCKCFVLLPDIKIKRELNIFGSRIAIKKTLNQIRILRNEIAHGQSILRFLKKDKINDEILLRPLTIKILQFIPDRNTANNRLVDINNAYRKNIEEFESFRLKLLENKKGYNEKDLNLISLNPHEVLK